MEVNWVGKTRRSNPVSPKPLERSPPSRADGSTDWWGRFGVHAYNNPSDVHANLELSGKKNRSPQKKRMSSEVKKLENRCLFEAPVAHICKSQHHKSTYKNLHDLKILALYFLTYLYTYIISYHNICKTTQNLRGSASGDSGLLRFPENWGASEKHSILQCRGFLPRAVKTSH